MRPYRTFVSAALVWGAATAWTPNSVPRTVKPATVVKNPTFVAPDFNPFHWVASGIVAVSLAFTPLPSLAADEGAVSAIPPQVVETITENTRVSSNADSSMTIATEEPTLEVRNSNADSSMTIAEAATEAPPKPVEAKKEEPKPAEAKKPEAPKPVEAKKEEPKPVEKKTEAPKPVEAKKEEPKPAEAKKTEAPKPVAAKKEAPKTAPKPVEKKEQKKAPVAKAAKKESKKAVKSSNKDSNNGVALGVGVAAVAAAGIGLSNSAGRDYSDPIRNTNSNDSNAPYSYDTYASGSYSDGLPKPRRRRYISAPYNGGGGTYRNGSNASRNSAADFATPIANSNTPYSQDTYSSGSYSDGLPRTTGNRYRPNRSSPSRSRDSSPSFPSNLGNSNAPYSEERYSGGYYPSSNGRRNNNRDWSNPLRNSRSERRTIPSDNSNAPYSRERAPYVQERYASGSYAHGYSNANRYRVNRRSPGGTYPNGFPILNGSKRRNERFEGADTVRKNGSVSRYLGDDRRDYDDGYNPKEPPLY